MIDYSSTRVLIIGINYWPEQTGIAPYTTEIAEHLAAAGASVKVITGVPHYPTWRIEAPYVRRLASRESRNGVEILRLRHLVPRVMTARRRAVYEASFCTHAILRAITEKPNLILAVTPSLGGAIAGAAVAKRAKCDLFLHVQDLMAMATSESGMTGAARTTALTARMEGAALRAATKVIVVSEGFRPPVKAYGVPDEDIVLLQNWIRITRNGRSREDARSQLGWPKDRFLVMYTGNMGFKQDLGNVIEAARKVHGTSLEILLIGDGSQRRDLQGQAKGLRNIRFLGLVEDSLYPTMLAAADVLLINERGTVAEMSIPSKITSYLAAARPIVAAVAPGSASHRSLEATDGAAQFVPPGDPNALASALVELAGQDAQLQNMSKAAADYATKHLGRDAALKSFDDVVAPTVADHSHARI